MLSKANAKIELSWALHSEAVAYSFSERPFVWTILKHSLSFLCALTFGHKNRKNSPIKLGCVSFVFLWITLSDPRPLGSRTHWLLWCMQHDPSGSWIIIINCTYLGTPISWTGNLSLALDRLKEKALHALFSLRKPANFSKLPPFLANKSE